MKGPLSLTAFRLVFLWSLLLSAGPLYGGELKESWYMSRGKANMRIHNYKAAIEAFEKLVEIKPDDPEAMRLLGKAYEAEGLTDKAIEQYDRYLERFPKDAEIAFKQAGFLEWSRYAYRKKDAIKYYRMGLAVREDRVNRHKLAKLLAADKKTMGEAVEEYRKLGASNPENKVLNAEYRKLLLWDGRYRKEAIAEYEKIARKYPGDREINLQLARLYAKEAAHRKDAVSQYRKLVDRYPGDLDMREEYAKALARTGSHFDSAKIQFETVLKRRDRLDTRLAYAELLAGEKTTYEQAAGQYEKLVGKHPGRVDIRLKYARLLGSRKENLDKAIAQYHVILQRQPGNPAAHQGLANAYAWKGDNDMAIHHSRKALAYQPGNIGASSLERDLMKGREPRVMAGVRFFDQGSDEENYELSGFQLATGGSGDPTPFLTCGGKIGLEKYWRDKEDIHGRFFTLDLQYRLDPERNLEASASYHAMEEAEGAGEFLLQYLFRRSDLELSAGIRREIKTDSLLSIGGGTDPVTGAKIGAARSNTAFCEISYTDKRFHIEATPHAGFISADTAGNNAVYGIGAKAKLPVMERDVFTVSISDLFSLTHYSEDHGGFEDTEASPLPGGYYSPRLFLNNALNLQLDYAFGPDERISLSGGPSYQFSEEHSAETISRIGANGSLDYLKRFHRAWHFNAAARYDQIAEIYNQYSIMGFITYRFM
ncbi:MAG: tetratricopeptide repeat protein [Thermodesulfobacteriota bacterium]